MSSYSSYRIKIPENSLLNAFYFDNFLTVYFFLFEQCRQKLVLRQQLIAEDIKIEKGFFAACHRDIKHYSCMQDSQGSQVLQRATVMLCLENAMKKGW